MLKSSASVKGPAMRRFLSAVLLLFAAPAMAHEHNTPADVQVACNAHGAVVTLGEGTIAPGRRYYLGKSCDAAQAGGGTGRWWYAAAAYVIEIDGRALRFAGELNCPALPYCRP